MIPYSRQKIDRNDIKSVIKVLKSEYLTQGPIVQTFEESIAEYCDSQYAVATNSATSALHIACLALGVKKGDIVWTSANSFVASANCALYCGATIDFVDIDPETCNISIPELEQKLQESKIKNGLPKVLIVVHYGGLSCDMKNISRLASEFNFSVIEDASHALGGEYEDKKIGNCYYSDITIFSFHPVKSITTGEGGAALTNNDNLYKKLKSLISHGITKDVDAFESQPCNEIWNYQQLTLGFNFRMNDIQASLGISQLKRLDSFILERNKIAQKYYQYLNLLPIGLPKVPTVGLSSFHLFPIRVNTVQSGKSQGEVYKYLRSAGISANVHYIPIHLQPYYKNLGFIRGMFPNAEKYFKECISLPIFPTLKKRHQNYVIQKLLNFFTGGKDEPKRYFFK